MPSELTFERACELFNYCPLTGVVNRKISTSNRVKAGAVAGYAGTKGYLRVEVGRKSMAVHRLIWLIQTGAFPSHHIDHINGCVTDNRWCNLRDVPNSINRQNMRRARRDNKLGFLGVSVDRNGKFRAQIQVDRKNKLLGSFATAEEAHKRYLEVKRQVHEGCTI